MKKALIIILMVALAFPFLIFADNGFLKMDKVDLVDIIFDLPIEENLMTDEEREVITKEYNVGYNPENNTLVAVGYGRNRNMAIVDAYRSAIKEIDYQLTARMNLFVSSTLVDMTDYVRFYAINRSRLVGMILEQSEDAVIEEMNGGVFVSRYVGTINFDTAFVAMINAATQQMGISEEVAGEAQILLNRLSGYYKEQTPKTFTFVNGVLAK